MDVEELRTFVEVAAAGGISGAARRLGLAKSIVSRRLLRLEDELGVPLLARNSRGVRLTEAGATFRAHAARACAEIDAARETIMPDGELRGRFRIAAPLTFGPAHFASVIADLARRHPRLHVDTCYTDRFVDLVGEGFDCGIRVGYLPDSDLLSRRVGPLYGQLVASPAYVEKHGAPETPQDLLAHQALMQGNESWQFEDGDAIVTVRPQGRFKADNGTALVAAAAAGLGIAWLPDGVTKDFLSSGALVAVMTRHPPPPAGIYVVRPPDQHPAPKVRALTEMLIDCFERSQGGA